MVKFLSPSALDVWLTNEEEYYLKYLANKRPPRIPQNQAMSVGSAFDAYVKCVVYQRLFGKNDVFVFETLFEKQVEVQNREFAIKAGAECFRAYRDGGSLDSLMKILEKSTDVQMEFTEKKQLDENGRIVESVGDVMLLGIPDLKFKYQELQVVHDWKVNGYTSRTGKSPSQGYVNFHGKIHKECAPAFVGDFCYNLMPTVEQFEPGWARQIATYGWLVGIPIGCEFICSVDQICCKPGDIKTAQHRCKISETFQRETYKLYTDLWERITSGHFFRNLSVEESAERCKLLDTKADAFEAEGPHAEWLRTALRK